MVEAINDDGAEAVLIVLCGLPGAGKTTLASRLACSTSHFDAAPGDCLMRRLQCERLSFDDLFAASSSSTSQTDFDPALWKHYQREMMTRVKAWRKAHEGANAKTTAQDGGLSSSEEEHLLVLLVDDNFQFRSLRKRFYQLACEVDCGFGILHVDTPVALCRQRNATREGAARVPDAVFERMVSVFEAPNGGLHAFERPTKTINPGPLLDVEMITTDGDCAAMEKDTLSELVQQVRVSRRERRQLAAETQKRDRQKMLDQQRTHANVVHQVDLELRKWISSVLQQHATGTPSSSCEEAPRTKAQVAQRLNQDRKGFLARLKTQQLTAGDEDGSQSSSGVIAALVLQFQNREQQQLD
ncbi:L-seryl-trna kinase, partial [Globisporangium splendens]